MMERLRTTVYVGMSGKGIVMQPGSVVRVPYISLTLGGRGIVHFRNGETQLYFERKSKRRRLS